MSTLFDLYGYLDRAGILWRLGEDWEANAMLSRHHCLGPLHSGARLTVVGAPPGDEPVAAMMWKHPTTRNLPADGTWLELSRWCLTPGAGENAGSRMHKWSLRLIREHLPEVTTLVSYSDPAHGHTGALYRACNWQWAPTWHRLRPAPSGHGDWGSGRQAVKDRWVFCVQRDERRAGVLAVDDPGAVRFWQRNRTDVERRWARNSLNLVDVEAGDVAPHDQLAATVDDPGATHARNHPIHSVDRHVPPLANAEEVTRVRVAPVQRHARDSTGRGGAA